MPPEALHFTAMGLFWGSQTLYQQHLASVLRMIGARPVD